MGVHGVRHPRGLRGCRQISKISVFVGISRLPVGIIEASIFMPILPTVSQLSKVIDILQHRINSTFILIRNIVNRVL